MTALRVFAVGRDDVAGWASTTLDGDVVVVREDDEVDRQPRGTAWLCPVADAEALRARRRGDAVVAIRPPVMPWGDLAHDVRSPVGVVSGALDEIEGDDAMVALARRGARQLAHHADCWYALATPIVPTSLELGDVLRDAITELSVLEPRRARQIQTTASEGAGVTDRDRLRLGLVRLLSHAVRATRAAVYAKARPGEIVLTAEDTLGLPSPEALAADPFGVGSSRLAMAQVLLGPLVEPWQLDHRVLRLVLRRAPDHA